MKHTLKSGCYVRYVDDFVILDSSKERLEFYKAKIDEFLKSIKLELHPDKSNIVPLAKGIKFLGFRVFYTHKLLKKGNIRRIEHRTDRFIEMYKDGIMDRQEVFERIEGWNAYAMHANTYILRRRITKKLKNSVR